MPKAKTSPADSLFATELTAAQAGELVGLTGRRLHQLAGEGTLTKTSKGKFLLKDVVQGYIAFLQDENRRASKSAAASRVTDARTQEIELRIIKGSQGLVADARADGLAVVDEVLGGIRADLAAAPARITADLEQRRKIETVLNDALRAASKRAGDAARSARAGGSAAAAGGRDDAGRMAAREPGLPDVKRPARAA